MPHDHDHPHHHHHRRESARSALVWALVANGVFMLVEVTVGLITGSLALLSDSLHMLTDVAALALALGASVAAERPAGAHSTFGWRRAEILGALANGTFLMVACAFIAREAWARLTNVSTMAPPGWPVFVVGAVGLAINLRSAWKLKAAAQDNLNVRGALAHVLGDALGSVGAVVAGVLMIAFGWASADAWASVATAGLILYSAWNLITETLRVLMQFAPLGLSVAAIEKALLNVDGIVAVHDLHVWSLDGSSAILTAHLVAEDGVTGWSVIRQRAELVLRDGFRVSHSTLQMEEQGACVPHCALAPNDEHTHGH